MNRWPLLTAVACAGLVAGALTTLAVQSPATTLPPEPRPSPTVTAKPAPLPTPDGSVLLVWSAGRLPDGLVAQLEQLDAVRAVTVVAGDRVELVGARSADGKVVQRLEDGWVIPLDALAIDPATYARIAPVADADAIAGLGPGRGLLSRTSAQLRQVGPGAVLELAGGTEVVVEAVVDDTTVAGAELVVARGTQLPVRTDRFLLLTYDGDRAELESAIRRLAAVDVRVRGPGETPFLRHGDAVLPQAVVKREFGEFAYRVDGDGPWFEQDPAWRKAHLVTTEVPILGTITCHRGIIDQLTVALQELVDRGLDHLVDESGFAGCHAGRFVSPAGSVSRHAWGVAVDLNAAANPTGVDSVQDPRLIESLTRWGFTWGGFWLVPDPMHFEYRGAPDPMPGKVGPDD